MQTSVYKLELYSNVFVFNAPLVMNTGHWKPFHVSNIRSNWVKLDLEIAAVTTTTPWILEIMKFTVKACMWTFLTKDLMVPPVSYSKAVSLNLTRRARSWTGQSSS